MIIKIVISIRHVSKKSPLTIANSAAIFQEINIIPNNQLYGKFINQTINSGHKFHFENMLLTILIHIKLHNIYLYIYISYPNN